MAGLSDNLKKAGVGAAKPEGPLWKGPQEDGITFSLLSRFLVCRERFRLHVIEGLAPAPAFNHRIEYGSMWHVCEEQFAAQQVGGPARVKDWQGALQEYAKFLCQKYPMAQAEIDHWYRVCQVQFPVYVDFWSKHPDVKHRTPLLQEVAFAVPYTLPSGRVVKLRGKWDSVDLIGGSPPCICGADRSGPSAEAHSSSCPAGKPHTVTGRGGIYLQENKTKGDIKESLIARQLTFDLQTMLYLVALSDKDSLPYTSVANREDDFRRYSILGVRYNVVRRPLSGGRHSITQHKPRGSSPGETKDAFYKRLAAEIREDPGYFFMRWQVEVSPQDIQKFKMECLDPVLEQLCDWWEYVKANGPITDPYDDMWSFNKHGVHWRRPHGVYNVLDEGGASDVDNYLQTGSIVGLQRMATLFPELES